MLRAAGKDATRAFLELHAPGTLSAHHDALCVGQLRPSRGGGGGAVVGAGSSGVGAGATSARRGGERGTSIVVSVDPHSCVGPQPAGDVAAKVSGMGPQSVRVGPGGTVHDPIDDDADGDDTPGAAAAAAGGVGGGAGAGTTAPGVMSRVGNGAVRAPAIAVPPILPYADPSWLQPGWHSPYFDDSHRELQRSMRR